MSKRTKGLLNTVLNDQDFSAIQIFRENNFKDSRGQKAAILIDLETLNSYFYEF